jgi:hypothetical protein
MGLKVSVVVLIAVMGAMSSVALARSKLPVAQSATFEKAEMPATGLEQSVGLHTLSLASQQPPSGDGAPDEPFVSERVTPQVVNIDLRTLPPLESWQPGDPVREIPRRVYPRPGQAGQAPERPSLDPLLALQESILQSTASSAFSTPTLNFEGVPFTGVHPPDTIGEVGPDHYVQIVNSIVGTEVAIFDKAGNPVTSFALDSLWTHGGPCASGHGDPIVLYDQLAARWLFSEFASSGNHLCVYISQGPDPVSGGWFLYDFPTPDFPDYPKYAVWPDAYYVSSNESSPAAYALDRNQMLVGGAATLQRFTATDLAGFDFQALIPSDLDGALPPLSGSPNYFMRHRDDEVHNVGANNPNQDYLEVWEYHVDWNTPANSTFTKTLDIAVTEFDSDLCGLFSFYCFPQPGTSVTLDPLREVIMWRLQYRNFDSYETLVGNLVTDVDGTDHGGIRWFELRKTGVGPWTLHQEGTYAPDAAHRWMGSIAMDGSGNIALGYSVSDATSTYPSIRYTGRLAGDPLGTMTQGEHNIIAGSGSQASVRWGDYSSMNVDPVDDCTFWYTNEYVAENNRWRTRIASFKFPECQTEPQGVLQGTISDFSTSDPITGATVLATGALITHTGGTFSGAGGAYSMLLGSDTYTVTASAYGYVASEVGAVDVISGTTTTLDILLAPASMYIISGTVTEATAGWPLYAKFAIAGNPFNPPTTEVWNDPTTGYYSVTLAAGVTYTLRMDPWAPGYASVDRVIPPLTANRTENYTLTADLAVCNSPGYNLNLLYGIYEQFEGGTLPSGWTIIDNAGTGEVWTFDDPGGRGNLTGGSGGFAIVDSDEYGSSGYQDTELRTPSLDFSGQSTVTIVFDTDYNTFSGSDVADVDVSINGGADWTNVWQKAGDGYPGPAHEVIDISALAAGESDVMVRFHYYDAYWEWWWQVDNVMVGLATCDLLPGGLVVGNVYDKNTNDGLVGATVDNDSGYQATTGASDEPGRGDGFYTLFSPAGAHVLTGTMLYYGSVITDVTVVQSDTVGPKDLYLPAGWITYTLPSYDITLQMGMSTTQLFTLTNIGTQNAEFELSDFVPWLSSDPISGTLPQSGELSVDLTFDAGEVDQPGEYFAALDVLNDTPYDVPYVPVTLTVPVPLTWGRLTGTVTSTGHCDVNSAPLAGAEVLIENGSTVSVTTDLDGVYSYWLEQGTYTLTVSAADHIGAATSVTISAQMTSTQDFVLRSLQPCIDIAPPSMEASLMPGELYTQALTMTNSGAGASTFNFLESPSAISWLSQDPISGTVGAESALPADITFAPPLTMTAGVYTGTLVVNTQDAVNSSVAVSITLTVEPPQPGWVKRVYINDELTTTFPAPVAAGDVVGIVDQVDIAFTKNITFTLLEEWSESLALQGFALSPGSLPGMSVVTNTGVLTWTVANLPSDQPYVITKTFTVLGGDWTVDYITETLWVEGATLQLPPVVREFQHVSSVVYLPVVIKN